MVWWSTGAQESEVNIENGKRNESFQSNQIYVHYSTEGTLLRITMHWIPVIYLNHKLETMLDQPFHWVCLIAVDAAEINKFKPLVFHLVCNNQKALTMETGNL